MKNVLAPKSNEDIKNTQLKSPRKEYIIPSQRMIDYILREKNCNLQKRKKIYCIRFFFNLTDKSNWNISMILHFFTSSKF